MEVIARRRRFLAALAVAVGVAVQIEGSISPQRALGLEGDVVVAASSDVQIASGLGTTSAMATSGLALEMSPDAAWLAGDETVDATAAEYTTYATHWGRFGSKLDVVPGNHDAKDLTAYSSYFGAVGTPLPRAKDVGTWRVYFLDSSVSLAVGSPTYSVLQSDLAAHAGRPIAAVWHIPRWSSDTVHGDNPKSSPIWDLLYAAHADLIINGHAHGYQRWTQMAPSGAADAAGIREFIVATGGRPGVAFGPADSRVEYRQNTDLGVLRLVLKPTSYEWRFVNTSRVVMDTGSTATHSRPGADTQPPTVPQNQTASAVDATHVGLGWSASTDNVAVTGYRVYRNGALLTTVGPVTSYTDATVTPATGYGYQVSAIDAAGNESARSSTATVTTPAAGDTQPPTVPPNLTAKAAGATVVDLRWQPSTDNVALAGYRIYRNGAQLTSVGAVTSYTDATAAPSTVYQYWLTAFDAAGNQSTSSNTARVKTRRR